MSRIGIKTLCVACGRLLPGAKTPLEMYERRVIKTASGCWGWKLKIGNTGYASLSFKGQKMLAHRFSYQYHVGHIPDGMAVLHKCDNRPCSNPDHLFLGTLDDNNKDMWAKGRGRTWAMPKGERCPVAKLTDKQVRRIKKELARGDARQLIADKYGVCKGTIKAILSGKTWTHIK